MNTIGERFRMIIEGENLNINSFSKRLSVSNTAITKIIKGESKPGFEIIEAVLNEFPYLSSDWLIHGTGSMAKNDSKNETGDKPGSYLQDYLEKLEKQFYEMKEMLNSELAVKNRQIEKLMDLLGKPSDVIGEAKEMPLWKKEEIRQVV